MKLVTNSYLLTRTRRKRKENLAKEIGKKTAAKIEVDYAADMAEIDFRKRDEYWAKRLGAELVRQYPGHGWQVESDVEQGIAKIFNRHVSGRYAWVLKFSDINNRTFTRDMMRIGGEMLRRYNIKSDRFDETEHMNLKRNFAGNFKVDLA